MNFAILGAGGIANTMAGTVREMEDVTCYAVAARDLARAQAFADAYGFAKAYGSYEEMLSDPAVDLVYIAVPHSHHYKWVMAALEAGRHVLCEKAFAVNAAQAEAMIRLAEEKGLLLTEAIWTRYMPSRALIDEVIRSGEIGEVKTISANLGYRIDMNQRLVDPKLAGGALLDLSVYTLNFASMILGDDIKRLQAGCVLTDTGVDGQDTIMVEYQDGKMASLFTTIYTLTDRSGYIYGTDGYIEVININNPEEIRIWNADREGPKIVKTIAVPPQITGYEYEVRACKRAIEAGQTECEEMPHAETLTIMRQMDEVRKQFGIVYPEIEAL